MLYCVNTIAELIKELWTDFTLCPLAAVCKSYRNLGFELSWVSSSVPPDKSNTWA